MVIKKLDVIFLFLISLLLFTFGIFSQEIIAFEARFFLFAQEMWRHGISWFPTTYQQPYPDYPATSTVFIYLIANVLGGLNKLTAVFPSAIAAALTVTMTYLIGALQNRAWGWAAAIFLLFTMTFVIEARTISLDQYIAFITTLSFYLAMRNKKLRWIVPLLILGFAIRGPIGVVIPTGVLCIFYLLDLNVKQFFLTGFSAVFVLMICTVILLGLAYHVGGQPFVHDVLRMEVGSRLNDANMPPVLFYLTESFGGYAVTYPLAVFALLGYLPLFFKKNPTAEIKFLHKLWGWVLVIMVGLSIPADKKLRYILPFAPALALICAGVFFGFTKNRYLGLLRKVFRYFCLVFPTLALMVTAYGYFKKFDFGLNYPILMVLFFILQLCVFFSRKRLLFVLGFAALTFYVGIVGIVETINLSTNQTRNFVLTIEAMRSKWQTPLTFFQEGADGMPIKYLVNMPREEKPLYLQRVDELTKLPMNTIVIVGKENFPHISEAVLQQFQIIMHGKIGHDGVVVLVKKP